MNTVKKTEILGIPFIHTTHNKLMNEIVIPSVINNEQLFIVTANPEIVMYAKENPSYKHTINNADYVVADGVGIIIASKMTKKPLPERIAGFELMESMLKYSNDNGKSIFLFGSKEQVIEKTTSKIKEKYPKIDIAGFHHGYVDLEDESIIEEIEEKEPDFIFVALGYPKQELWIERYKGRLKKGIFMGVGGSFDIWAGEAKRAPKLWIKLNLEWLYRLVSQPKRFKRVLKLPQFLLHVLRGK